MSTAHDRTTPTPDAVALLSDGAIGLIDAVAFTGLSRAELYRQMTAGELPYVIRGRRRLIPRRSLVELLASGLRGGVDRSDA